MKIFRKIQDKLSDLFWDVGESLPDVPVTLALGIAIIALIVSCSR